MPLHAITKKNYQANNGGIQMSFNLLQQDSENLRQHIQGLLYKEAIGEISIEEHSKRELVKASNRIVKRQNELMNLSSQSTPILGDFTLEEIAKIMGITRERVRQNETSALKKIKNPKIGRKLKNYLEM